MQHADILMTLAEIGVTIAGFSSLATMLLTDAGRRAMAIDTYRFEGMLINSLLVIGFALLPLLLDALGIAPQRCWQIASLLLLVVFGSRGFLVTRSTLRFRKAGAPIGLPFLVMTGLLLVALIVLAINVVFVPTHLAGGLYLFGVSSVLANACVLFLLVFVSALRSDRDD